MPYTRRELWILLALAAIFCAGLGVREWRAGFPAAAERIERFDREEPPEPLPPAPLPAPRPPRRAAHTAVGGERPVSPRPAAASSKPAEVARPEPPADPRPLDLNGATLEQIARLPGVGPGLARRIVDERERRGRFDSPEALRGVLGLGPKKLAALRELVAVGDAAE
jgi:competence ComEA-like helix-hairpin-helix protein